MKKLYNTKTLTIGAMLTAIGIILGFFKIPINKIIEIRFGSLPIALGGMLFGPAVAGVIGALTDIGGYLIKPTGPFFPGFTISNIVSGIIFGLFLYKKKCSFVRILIAELVNTLIVGILMNSYWLYIMYFPKDFTANLVLGSHIIEMSGFVAVIGSRLIKEIVMIPILSVFIYVVIKALEKVGVRKLAV